MRTGSRRCAMGLALLALVAAALPADAAPYLRPGVTERISVASDGAQAVDPVETPLGTAWDSAISADGRFVAFSSTASNLVPGDTNAASDIFVRDRQTNRTEIVSVASNGARAAGACLVGGVVGSTSPSITADGRYVSFTSCATNLVPGDLNLARDGFVHDRLKKTTEIVSVSSEGKQGTMPAASHDSFASSISPDGRFVAISSMASDLVPNDTNEFQDAFLFDRQTRKMQRVSVNTAEQQTSHSVPRLTGHSNAASVSLNGQFVVFNSSADNLVAGDTNNMQDVFVRDVVKGTTEIVSVRTGAIQTGGAGVITSGGRAISSDGRYVLVNSNANDLIPNDNNDFDTFVFDRMSRRMERISVRSDGAESDGSNNSGSLSLDGRYVAFSSQANNLGAGDTGSNGSNTTTVGAQPGDYDLMVYDRKFGTVEMVSRAPNGDEAKGHCKITNDLLSADSSESVGGSINSDGRYVAYQSCATNLVPGDTNKTRDHFLRDRGAHLGVRGVTATGGSKVAVTGFATFSGAVLGAAFDPPTDGTASAALSGAELVKSELLYRPELEDLLLRMDVTQMPSAGVSLSGLSAPGDPRVLYSLRFSAAGQNYEVRVHRIGANTTNPLDASFGLFSCTENTCTQVAALKGGYGTTGEQIAVSIPLAVITKDGKAVTEGATFASMRAYTSLGTYFGGEATLLDQVLLSKVPSVPLPVRSVTATIGRTSVRASLVNGKFTASFPRSAFGPSRRANVVFRTCLGTECQLDRVQVSA